MNDFLDIACLPPDEVKKIEAAIEGNIREKTAEGLFSERDIREIEHMPLRPIPDLLDVQSVYENHLYTHSD
ncbi:MAG: hypothetical protein A2Y56_04710 [Candidatus Aminicenantes bacterium RBG_13_63_10]|nr:MAG: hypothetical protein A2Y56_04710 [Candidatus Aminicenantes bacterium RBG_13_63_10]